MQTTIAHFTHKYKRVKVLMWVCHKSDDLYEFVPSLRSIIAMFNKKLSYLLGVVGRNSYLTCRVKNIGNQTVSLIDIANCI